MSDANKAVFLSYASQDAEAAKRICEALRAAGVEVWFDQSELRGGDSWDQKIRRQIKECALFVPVISASTQARAEGYFRREWRLAVDRMHDLADDHPFLVPVVIDATPDAAARVPERFRERQWTRLPDGETPPAFAARLKKLLGGDTVAGVARGELVESGDPGMERRAKPGLPPAATVRPARSRRWLWPTLIGVAVVAAILVSQSARWSGPPASTETRAPSLPAAPPPALNSSNGPSEARQLVAKAWQAIESVPEPSRAELEAATELCKRAASLDATDADVWAAWSQVETWYVAENVDASAARRESARAKATKAMNLAPGSYEARLAQAAYLVRGEGFDAASSFAAEAEQLLRELLREKPDEPRALLALGHLLRNSKRLDEAGPLFDRLALNPAWLATATNAKGWMFAINGRFDEAGPLAAQSVAARPFYGNVCLQVKLAMQWQGDLELAKAALERLPVADLREDAGATLAIEVYRIRREPEQMLRVLHALPREWLESLAGNYPTSYLKGVAHQMAGNTVAARLDWQTALKLLEQRLATEGNSGEGQWGKGCLLALLGERPAAEQAFALAKQLGWLGGGVESALLLGDQETAITELEKASSQRWAQSWAELRLNPDFDPLRANPRFQALLAAAEKDPKRCPHAKLLARAAVAETSEADSKSVAVLAFTNLSDDKGNEYFSDGISEELLNVLAKIPDLKVAARTSSFYFKGKEVPMPEIARQLGVAYVVEGSVRKAGERVRITAQLIKAADGFHVWSDTFTRELKDIFGVQDEIAGLIAKNLELKMGIGEIGSRPAIGAEAYQEFLLGRAAATKASMADLHEAVTRFERAVALEPKYADAWVQLASAHTQLGRWGGAPTLQSWQAARAAIDHARALEPDSPEMLLALGWIQRTSDWDWRGAEQTFRRALQLRPNQPEVLAGAAVLLFNIGKTEEAFRLGQQAALLDPLNPSTQIDLSIMFYLNRNWAEAERTARRALQLAPGGTSYHSILAWSLVAQKRFAEAESEAVQDTDEVEKPTALGFLAIARGQPAAAREQLARLEEISRTRGDTADLQQCIAWLTAAMGEKDRAFAALDKARASRDPSISWLRNSFYLEPLYSDPRWNVFLHQVGLADDQLK